LFETKTDIFSNNNSPTSKKPCIISQPITWKKLHGDKYVVPVCHSEMVSPIQYIPQQVRVAKYKEHWKKQQQINVKLNASCTNVMYKQLCDALLCGTHLMC
jgi:hypothetical protein